ncbi:MAG TPA: hypothetical protein VNB06_10485 [Thermoanaerobaculia bacterium]|nr:hypothetical protein [Thermoanaerobaculia bacterium]
MGLALVQRVELGERRLEVRQSDGRRGSVLDLAQGDEIGGSPSCAPQV